MTPWSKWLRRHWRLLVSALVLLAVLLWLGGSWALGALRPDDPLGQVVAPALRVIRDSGRLVVTLYGVWCLAAGVEAALRTVVLRSRS